MPPIPDALRPAEADVLAAWAARVTAERAQTDRCREVADPADFYSPTAHRFRFDPEAEPDAVGRELAARARPLDVWLDVGAGGGRYALPVARLTRRVIAVEPSAAMRDTLRAGMADAGVENVDIVDVRWPPAGWASDPAALEPFRADVGLMAHVGYDIEDIGPFLSALERVARRLCIAVMGESAMTTVGARYWAPIHGEPRVPLPALGGPAHAAAGEGTTAGGAPGRPGDADLRVVRGAPRTGAAPALAAPGLGTGREAGGAAAGGRRGDRRDLDAARGPGTHRHRDLVAHPAALRRPSRTRHEPRRSQCAAAHGWRM